MNVYRMPFGKYAGQALCLMVFQPKKLDYLRWVAKKQGFSAPGIQKRAQELLAAGERLQFKSKCKCGNTVSHAMVYIHGMGINVLSLHCQDCLPKAYGQEQVVPLRLSSTRNFDTAIDKAKFLGVLKSALGFPGRLNAEKVLEAFFPPETEEESDPELEPSFTVGSNGQLQLF